LFILITQDRQKIITKTIIPFLGTEVLHYVR
jgi:hypothetical protein